MWINDINMPTFAMTNALVPGQLYNVLRVSDIVLKDVDESTITKPMQYTPKR